jgi:uncharacterized protein (DUF433 family)
MLGTGIYTPAEAASLLKAPADEVRRWAFGYSRVRDGERVRYPALIRTELPEIEGQRALTFIELVELMYIKAFRKAGAPWHLIDEAAGAVQPYLAQLDFDSADVPTRWWPLGREHGVVVDPQVSFGAPVLADAGIPTRTLADVYAGEQEYDAGRALNRVAHMYRITPAQVERAVQFEEWRAAA